MTLTKNCHTPIILIILSLTLSSTILSSSGLAAPRFIISSQPQGHFYGPAGYSPIFWSGDQSINNTSFENGNYQPWTASSYNANQSNAVMISPGLNDNYAVQLSITSGNLTSDSYERLIQDLSATQATFSNDTMLQASVRVTSLTGNSSFDRAGVIVSLVTSTGPVVRLHYVFASGAGLPTNNTSAAYFKVPGFGSSGWINITRNLASDTRSAFPSLASTVDSVRDVSLYVDSMSYPMPNRDPRIRFFDNNSTGVWNTNDTVVYDSDMDGKYQSGDPVLWTGRYFPIAGTSPVVTDPMIKFVDTNQNHVWDTGESIVYDCNNTIPGDCNNNRVDVNEPVISGNPIIGQQLADPIRRFTTALFDDVRLYTPTNYGTNIIVNGAFQTGTLSGWGNQAGFSVASLYPGSLSAHGSVTSGDIQLAQSIDSQPKITANSAFAASVFTGSLTGISTNDTVDVWLGLSDGKGTPVSSYYEFATGSGLLPTNATGVAYYKVGAFGTQNRWINFTRTLAGDTSYFDQQGFSEPYSVNLVSLEVRSQGSNPASAYFTNISFRPNQQQTSYATVTYNVLNGQNATYNYLAKVPAAAFSVQLPMGQSILNITTPSSTTLQPSDYTVTYGPTFYNVSIPNATGTRYTINGVYYIYTSSRNTVSSIRVEDTTSLAILNLTQAMTPSRRVDVVELSLDPYAAPIPGANSTISIWSQNGTQLNSWTGSADLTGFYRVHDIALPSADGTYTLQATSYSAAGVGVRDRQFTITTPSTPGPFSPYLIALIVVAIIAGITGFLIYRKRKRVQPPLASAQQPNRTKKNARPQQQQQQKKK